MKLTDSDLTDIQEALNVRIHSALELADEIELSSDGEDPRADRLRARAQRLLRVLVKVST